MALWSDDGEHRRRRDWLRNSMIGTWSVIVIVIAGIALAIKGYVLRPHPRRVTSEMAALKGAVQMYINDHSAYPPDTGSWNETVFDPRSLHRYLGSELKNPVTGRTREPYFMMRRKSLTDLDADGVGIFVDPWGNPYHLDAMHVTRKDGRYVQIGWPVRQEKPGEGGCHVNACS